MNKTESYEYIKYFGKEKKNKCLKERATRMTFLCECYRSVRTNNKPPHAVRKGFWFIGKGSRSNSSLRPGNLLFS